MLAAADRWLLPDVGRTYSPSPESYFLEQPGVARQTARDPAGSPSIPTMVRNLLSGRYLDDGLRLRDETWAQVVCDCSGGYTWKWTNPPEQPFLGCVESCVEVHEKDHIAYLGKHLPNGCKGRKSGETPRAPSEREARLIESCSECSAYGASVKCLGRIQRTNERRKNGAYCAFVSRQVLRGQEAKLEKHCASCGSS